MIRGDNIICGTSTTGTGTLTLAATPGPPGGVDFDVFARATGIGFSNSAAVLVSYTIIEYTSSAFTTAKATEKGIGTLTLGGSAGIANATLARTKLQTSATSLNSQPATQNIKPGTGISIGTAANTLVFIGASAADTLAFSPFVNSGSTTNGYMPLMVGNSDFNGGGSVVNNQNWTWPFTWAFSALIKRAYFRVEDPYSGAVSNLYARIYDISSSGNAGKLLYDFGVVGTPNSSFDVGNFTIIASGASGAGYLMTPGDYFMQVCPIWTLGGSGTPSLTQYAAGSGPILSGAFGNSSTVFNKSTLYDNHGGSVAADPANVDGGDVSFIPFFALDVS
jgi:hypothetical protein